MPLHPQIRKESGMKPDAGLESATAPGVQNDCPDPSQGKKEKPQVRAGRSAMRGILKIICFFGLIILLVYGMNAMLNSGLRRIKTCQFGVSNAIVEGKINADIIITGSSRAVSHYDPRIIQSVTGLTAFNIGRNGSQTDMQLAVLKTYLKHNRKPRIVIHNLDAFSFVMTTEVYDPGQYLPYLGEKDLYDALKIINPKLWWKCKYLPLYGYMVEDMRLDWMQGPLGLLGWSPRENFFQGFNPRTGTWTEDFASFRAANPDGVTFEIQPAGVKVMEDLIHVCQENGIMLILVYSPEYREMQSLTRNRADIFNEFQKLSQSPGVLLWDFSNWKDADDTNFFMNSQHLNAQGAQIFSTDLAHRLVEQLPRLSASLFHPGS